MNDPILATDRLVLRRMSVGDAAFMLGLLNQPSFIRNIGDRQVRTETDAVHYIESGTIASYTQYGFGMYIVELAGLAEPVGVCGLVKRDALPDVDIGFAFLPEFWGKGYAVEAARAVKVYALETLDLSRLIAITAVDNLGSISVLEKIGLEFEKMIRLPDEDTDLKLYSTERVSRSVSA